MNLQIMANMALKQLLRGMGLLMLMVGLLPSPCHADEIIFKDQGAQSGTVLEVHEKTVTIRFPMESIQSIITSREGVSSPEKADEIVFKDQGVQTGKVLEIREKTVTIRFPMESIQSIITSQERVSSPEKKGHLKVVPLTAPQLEGGIKGKQEGIERLEENLPKDKKAAGSPTQGPSKNTVTIEQLLREEMGRVKGVVLWKGKPLANGSVMIILETYTGFSWASLKKMFSKNKEKSSGEEITLTTQTDSQGRYIFEEAPPGKYRLYLTPDPQTGWLRRLQEKPDFEVIASQLTVYNIPGEEK